LPNAGDGGTGIIKSAKRKVSSVCDEESLNFLATERQTFRDSDLPT